MFDAQQPQPLGEAKEHYWLIQRMAQANGTDLVAAHDSGALSQKDWAGMVQRCRACQWAEGCQRWLDRTGAALRDTPESCVNRDTFAAIQAQLRE